MNSNSLSFKNKIRNYSILAGSALAAVNTADGQIVYHNITPDVILNAPGETYNLDLNGDGTTDAELFQRRGYFISSTLNGFFQKAGLSMVGTVRLVHYGGSTIFPLGVASVVNPGSTIGGSKNWASYQALQSSNGFEDDCLLAGANKVNGYYAIGNWVAGETNKFIGFRIKSGTSYNYGWLRCTEAPGATSLTISDYAYQTTPNTPIVAGDTGCSTTKIYIVAFNKNLCHGDTTRLKLFNVQPGDTYDWFRGSEKIAITKYLHSIIVSEPGNYWAKIKSSDGCVAVSDTVEVRDLSSSQTDELSTFMEGDLQNIYTFKKVLHVNLSNSNYLQDGMIQIFNSEGENVLRQSVTSRDFTMNLQSLISGIYFVKLSNGKSEINRKIFLE